MTLVKLTSGTVIKFEEIESVSTNGNLFQVRMEGCFSPYVTKEEYDALIRHMPTLLEHIAFLSRQDTGSCAMTLDDGTVIMSREIEAVIASGEFIDTNRGRKMPAYWIVSRSGNRYQITEAEYRHFAGLEEHHKERNRNASTASPDNIPNPP